MTYHLTVHGPSGLLQLCAPGSQVMSPQAGAQMDSEGCVWFSSVLFSRLWVTLSLRSSSPRGSGSVLVRPAGLGGEDRASDLPRVCGKALFATQGRPISSIYLLFIFQSIFFSSFQSHAGHFQLDRSWLASVLRSFATAARHRFSLPLLAAATY